MLQVQGPHKEDTSTTQWFSENTSISPTQEELNGISEVEPRHQSFSKAP